MSLLAKGASGPDVRCLCERLTELGLLDAGTLEVFDGLVEQAVRVFQTSAGLAVDGKVGYRTSAALRLIYPNDPPLGLGWITIDCVCAMFPGTKRAHILSNLPVVLGALIADDLSDIPMVLMALATIRAESAQFLPIDENVSKHNTSPGGHPFDLYDDRADLGNRGYPDGERYKGRGYVQLTGRYNYRDIGRKLGVDDNLVEHPELANDPEVASRILSCFLKSREMAIRSALRQNDLGRARKLVNGGSHGLKKFTACHRIGTELFAAELAPALT